MGITQKSFSRQVIFDMSELACYWLRFLAVAVSKMGSIIFESHSGLERTGNLENYGSERPHRDAIPSSGSAPIGLNQFTFRVRAFKTFLEPVQPSPIHD
jgi:hypothetical protein